ncbi:TPA: lytic transglycosylase domain-containing protein [Enterobacter hormaechei]
MIDISSLMGQCGITTNIHELEGIIKVESSFNQYAIGIVGGKLVRQPTNKHEAVLTAKRLVALGRNFSLGLGQINLHNLSKYNLSIETAFNPCSNLHAASLIYRDCYTRALERYNTSFAKLAALSCYYSGNFKRGFSRDDGFNTSYIERFNKMYGYSNEYVSDKYRSSIVLDKRIVHGERITESFLESIKRDQLQGHIREIRGD